MSGSLLGAVLAGGPSRRMGRSKALLPTDGKTFVERAVAVLSQVAARVVVVGGAAPEGWDPAIEWWADREAGLGPLGGLWTALESGSGPVLVLAVDLPAVGAADLAAVAPPAVGFGDDGPEVRVAVFGGRRQPLCATYSESCREAVAERIAAGRLAMHGLLSRIRVTEIPLVAVKSGVEDPLVNINTPADFESWTAAESRRGT